MSEDLLEAARAVRRYAHAPYSGFSVGAAVRTASGKIFAGCNVENASYPEGICAEAGALGQMVAAGESAVVEVAVVAAGDFLCSPCGGCRQRLAEFADGATPVHMGDDLELKKTATLGDLLPLAFSDKNLGKSRAPVQGAAETIIEIAGDRPPKIAIMLGSGLSALSDALLDRQSLAYADLPGFPKPSVSGHSGTLHLGTLEGVPVCCLAGRVHRYEGKPVAAINPMIRAVRQAGCELLILTNAAGSLNPDVPAGRIVLISDHINMLGDNPLVGPNDDDIGPRFPDMSEVYDRNLRQVMKDAAAERGSSLSEGIYLAYLGPSFETPAEIRASRTMGADLVGMSTVPEAISARHAGLRVLGFSVVTNLAAGLNPTPLSHEETLAAGAAAADELIGLLRASMGALADELGRH